MFKQGSVQEVINVPVPEVEGIHYAGDGRLFCLKDNIGADGIVGVFTGQGAPSYNNSKTEEIDGMNYSKFFCDYHVLKNVKIQGADIKISRGGEKDFSALEILYLANADPELWVLGRRFVHRLYISTDTEDQKTPNLPYGKILESSKFIVRMVYYKHESNTQEICARINYVMHEVDNV